MNKIKGKLTFYYDVVQGTQEWLNARQGRVTCSNALMLMNKGKNACMEANRLAAARLTPNGNFYAERGHVIEHEMKQAYNEQLKKRNLTLAECGFITNTDFPDAGYSPDGLICPLCSDGEPDLDNIEGLAEFKAYNDIVERDGKKVLTCKHRQACFDILKVPPQAIAQCNMAMLLTETEAVYLFLCNPDAADTDEMIKKLLKRREELFKIPAKNRTKENAKELVEVMQQLSSAGDVDVQTPQTKVWLIRRNKIICDRLMEKLSQGETK